jgi:hypothetical protein
MHNFNLCTFNLETFHDRLLTHNMDPEGSDVKSFLIGEDFFREFFE